MAPSASQAGSQRWRGAYHIRCDAPPWAAHGRSGLVLSCSAHAYEPGDAASPVAKCTMDRRMQEVIPGACVCSVLSQKGTACAGLRLELLIIRTIAGRCMVGCLRMIMVHIIGGLSVRVLEDVHEVAMFVRRSQQHIRHRPLLTVKGNTVSWALRSKPSIASLSAPDMKAAVSRVDMSSFDMSTVQAEVARAILHDQESEADSSDSSVSSLSDMQSPTHIPSLEVGFTRCSPTRCCRTCNAGSSFSSQQEQQRVNHTNSCMADMVEMYASQNYAFASCSRQTGSVPDNSPRHTRHETTLTRFPLGSPGVLTPPTMIQHTRTHGRRS